MLEELFSGFMKDNYEKRDFIHFRIRSDLPKMSSRVDYLQLCLEYLHILERKIGNECTRPLQ